MKKLLILTALAIAMARLPVHAQMVATLDAFVQGLFVDTWLEQTVHYAQTAMQWAKELDHFKQQAEHAAFVVERNLQNLQSAGDIHSYKDFMNWYNRQLYYERQTMDAFKNANINIGKKNYKFSDVEGIASGLKETYVDYWNNEFTEDQRREMWLDLGLTPANYAFVQPLRSKAHDLYQQNLFASEVQNEEYMADMQNNNKWQNKMDADKNKDSKDKMGEKEILEGMLETELNNNRALNNISMYTARQLEIAATDKYIQDTPYDAPPMSDWPEDGFKHKKKENRK